MYTENHLGEHFYIGCFWIFIFELIEGMLPFPNMNHPLDYYLGFPILNDDISFLKKDSLFFINYIQTK